MVSAVETLHAAMRVYPMDPGLALHRATEAMLMPATLVAPVLDLGCHDGTFTRLAVAGRVTGRGLFGCDRSPAIGDESPFDGLVTAEASRLPFAPATFASVVCNSVLAHVADLDAALAEIRRVLRRGGRLVASVPTPRFHALRASCRVVRGVAGTRAAARMARRYDRRWEQRHLLEREAWRVRLAVAGFHLERWTEYLGGRSGVVWSALFAATRCGVGRLTVGAALRRALPRGTRRAAAVERRLAVTLAPHLGATSDGGSAVLEARA
jgi:SAM-dependent methyltransferase